MVRTDLGMTKVCCPFYYPSPQRLADIYNHQGKIGAQCGHATLMCYKSSMKHAPHLVRIWENLGQTKVAVQAKGGEEELVMLQAQAMSLGVVARIVHDAGRTQIAAGSATVLGIGPGELLTFSFESRGLLMEETRSAGICG